jgi:hypothetical protein
VQLKSSFHLAVRGFLRLFHTLTALVRGAGGPTAPHFLQRMLQNPSGLASARSQEQQNGQPNQSVQATADSLAVWMFVSVLTLWDCRAVPDLYRSEYR